MKHLKKEMNMWIPLPVKFELLLITCILFSRTYGTSIQNGKHIASDASEGDALELPLLCIGLAFVNSSLFSDSSEQPRDQEYQRTQLPQTRL